MKRTAFCRNTVPELRAHWVQAGHVVPRAIAVDTFEDRISEYIFDVEGEREEVDIIINKISCGVT